MYNNSVKSSNYSVVVFLTLFFCSLSVTYEPHLSKLPTCLSVTGVTCQKSINDKLSAIVCSVLLVKSYHNLVIIVSLRWQSLLSIKFMNNWHRTPNTVARSPSLSSFDMAKPSADECFMSFFD